MEALVSKAKYDELEGKYNALEHRFNELLKMLQDFKSERLKPTIGPEQMALWGEDAGAGVEGPAGRDKITYERCKKRTIQDAPSCPNTSPLKKRFSNRRKTPTAWNTSVRKLAIASTTAPANSSSAAASVKILTARRRWLHDDPRD